jgi:WD40 repeat protein
VPSGAAELWPVGVIDGPPTEEAVTGFVTHVHAQFAAADGQVRSVLVYRGPAAPASLVELARQRGVRLQGFTDFQGLLDLGPLADRQREQLAGDRVYPARLYVEQRFTVGDDPEVCTGLIRRTVEWLSAEDARLIVVLGDFGRGKTSFLRQLTRRLPEELPSVLPVLVELRTLEKAPTLDELLAQYLIRQGVEDISPAKLRYMISSGRLALLFDGFDELELRVGYDNAADYLQTLLDSVKDRAKVILTSRTQHFRDTSQVRTALGERVEMRAASRMVILEEFTDEQILRFLTNLYDGDASRAQARFGLISGIGNLLDLVHNPRMLAFVAALDTARLETIRERQGSITHADLYREIIDYWLEVEEKRQQYDKGLPSLSKENRLKACTRLAHHLWSSASPTIAENELSAEVTDTLTDLAELGYTQDQASHAIASGSLLVKADDGTFRFIHQSIMEWLVADAAAKSADRSILATRRMSRLMAGFFADLADADAARRWADELLRAEQVPESGKLNALDVTLQLAARRSQADSGKLSVPGRTTEYLNLRGINLRGLDLTGLDLHGADLSGADLSGADLSGLRLTDANLAKANLTRAKLGGLRLTRTVLSDAHLNGAHLNGAHLLEADLSGADLRGTDLTGVRMTGGWLRDSQLAGSNWTRSTLLGTEGIPDPTSVPELRAAAIAGRDEPDLMIQPRSDPQSVAFSPDGTLIAIGIYATIELIDATSGQSVRILRGHTAYVCGVAFSPDGTLIATASADNTARTWDAATGQHRTTLTGHDNEVWGIAFSPDGTLIATASADNTARTWDAATGQHRTTLTGHDNDVTAVAFSPDGTLIATASGDGTARTWDAATGQHRTTLTGHNDWVHGIAFSPDGTLIATASDDRTARTWDAATGQHRTTLTGHNDWVRGIAFSPDGTLIATASDDRTARTWDAATGQHRTTLTGHNDWVRGIAFSPDGTLIATTSDDRTARTWDAATGQHRTTFAQLAQVNDVVFSPDGTLIATASADNTARTWDAATGQHRTTLTGHNSSVLKVAFSPDGTLIATASRDGTARTWDAATGQHRTTLTGHDNDVNAIAFSPDGTLIATASRDGTARTWDAATGQHRTTLTGHDDEVWGIAFSPDGTLIATASDDRTARTWDAATGQHRTTLTGHDDWVRGIAFSPDGTLIATTSADRTARTWDAATGQHRTTLTGHNNDVWGVAFSPDGTLIATASADKTARTWDAATGQHRTTLTGHNSSVWRIAFSPDGTLIATASADNTARIWDTAASAHLVTLVPLPNSGYATLLPDGSYKLAGDPRDRLWWAIKLCRFEPGELDPYVPSIRRLPPEAPVLPLRHLSR